MPFWTRSLLVAGIAALAMGCRKPRESPAPGVAEPAHGDPVGTDPGGSPAPPTEAEHVEEPTQASCADGPGGPPAEAPETDASWLVLEGLDHDVRRVRYRPVRVDEGAPRIGDEFAMRAWDHPGSEEYAQAPASTVVRGHFLVVAEIPDGEERTYVLERRRLGETSSPEAVGLGQGRPGDVFSVGRLAYVGRVGGISVVDFGADPPDVRTLYEREEAKWKPYDLFLRTADLLIAIDDESAPFFADGFRLDASGRATHEAAWELPSLVNGSYSTGALHDDVLYLLADYGIRYGPGHFAVAIPFARLPEIRNGADSPSQGGSERIVFLEEGANRDRSVRVPLLAGSDYTDWAGLGVIADRLLIGAGSRGILVIEIPFVPETAATLLGVGGECVDLVVLGETAYALVAGEGTTSVSVIRRDAESSAFRIASTFPVEGAYRSFVR